MPARQTPPPMPVRDIGRKQRGDFPTPPALVQTVLDGVLPELPAGSTVRLLDPACGDGRFLAAAAERLARGDVTVEVHGVELDAGNAAEARRTLAAMHGERMRARVDTADALTFDWGGARYDLVVGNPPYLSQLAAATTRGGSSRRGGGPYADVAAEFLALAVQLARPDGGRVGLVLPQSILASRDVGAIRQRVEEAAEMIWSWWSPVRQFDASVYVCALGFERRGGDAPSGGNSAAVRGDRTPVWTGVICRALGVPELPPLRTDGSVGDRARCSADFRDCYYGLIPGVGDHESGPPLVTSGLIDPGRCSWGERTVRYGGRRWQAPRVDVAALDRRSAAWAESMATPKVLVANQSRVIECVADHEGTMLPAVPVITARPFETLATRETFDDAAGPAWEVAAVLTSPVASAAVWHRAAGTGLSASAIRVSPALIAAVPWPAGSVASAVSALRDGDIASCGRLVDEAYGVVDDDAASLEHWWTDRLPAGSPRTL
jgi:hypothetical protein